MLELGKCPTEDGAQFLRSKKHHWDSIKHKENKEVPKKTDFSQEKKTSKTRTTGANPHLQTPLQFPAPQKGGHLKAKLPLLELKLCSLL